MPEFKVEKEPKYKIGDEVLRASDLTRTHIISGIRCNVPAKDPPFYSYYYDFDNSVHPAVEHTLLTKQEALELLDSRYKADRAKIEGVNND